VEMNAEEAPMESSGKVAFESEDAGVGGGDVCWIYYTSGSTGRAKGVVCQHRCATSAAAAAASPAKE